MVRLIIDISSKELEKMLSTFPDKKIDLIRIGLTEWNGQRKRIDKLQDYLLFQMKDHYISLEKLFKRMKYKGYPLTRKTFTRDIKELVDRKVIKYKVIKGGKLGSTSIITINKQANYTPIQKENGIYGRKRDI